MLPCPKKNGRALCQAALGQAGPKQKKGARAGPPDSGVALFPVLCFHHHKADKFFPLWDFFRFPAVY
jgi:hypothetical protein